MDILNKYENGKSPVQKTSLDLTSPALNEVIAEIDREAGRINPAGPEENKEAGKLVGGIESRSSQFIQFTLESTFFALPLSNALEIGHRPEIAPLPNLPKWILGISNVSFGLPPAGLFRSPRLVRTLMPPSFMTRRARMSASVSSTVARYSCNAICGEMHQNMQGILVVKA